MSPKLAENLGFNRQNLAKYYQWHKFILHFGSNKRCFIPRHALHTFSPYQNCTVWHLCAKVAPKSVASLWPIVQGQLNWRLSQGTRYPKENSNSWNVSEAPTGCEPFPTSSFAENPAGQHNENVGLCCHLHHERIPRCWVEGLGGFSILGLVKYSHRCEQRVRHPRDLSQAHGWKPAPWPAAPNLAQCLGMSSLEPAGFMGTPSIIASREKKIYNKKETAKKE